MPNLTTFPVSSIGGLDIVTPPQLLSNKPGAAVQLENYEALTEGGYRRIRGYTPIDFDGNVDDAGDIRGIHTYQGRPTIIKGLSVYMLDDDNVTWLDMNAGTDLVGTARGDMCTITPAADEVLFICDGNGGGVPMVVKRTSGGVQAPVSVTPASTLGARWCTKYQDHMVIAGMTNRPTEVFVSTRFDPESFDGTGSWSFQVADEITGLHTFRGSLYVFCKQSIYRVKNLEQAAAAVVEPVTLKIGCLDHFSIQEVGGDVLFLANDGLRYLGATERIDDVALNLQSSLIDDLIAQISQFQGNISSTVIASKRQYRLFYYDTSGIRRGLIGTLQGNGSFSWTTTTDMEVDFVHANAENPASFTYHASESAVFTHDVGNLFNVSPFTAVYRSPYFNLGDASVRKRCHSLTVYLEAEDTAVIQVFLRFDFESTRVHQPAPFDLAPVVSASRFGSAIFGSATYGAIRFPLDSIFLEGSGKWVQFEFRDDDTSNSRYVIRGFDLNFTPAGRI